MSVFHEFHRDVRAAQQAFIEKLVKSEPNQGEAVALSPIFVLVEGPSSELDASRTVDDAAAPLVVPFSGSDADNENDSVAGSAKGSVQSICDAVKMEIDEMSSGRFYFTVIYRI